jgi:hypothetical protein
MRDTKTRGRAPNSGATGVHVGTQAMTAMKTGMLILLLLGALAVSGCARNYVMTMSNGTRVTTASKPKLKSGTYYYKDAMGRQVTMPAGRVQQIEPASMAKKEDSPMFKPTPSR